MTVDLTGADHEIIEMLADGRCTVGYLAEELTYSRQHIHNRLNVLVAAEYVKKRHDPTGLYELVRDPRKKA